MKKFAILALSGGMDSSTLLLRLLAEGYQVTAIGFDYGQKHRVELERAQQLTMYISSKLGSDKLKFQVVHLVGLSQLLNSTLVRGGSEVPEGHYQEENMKSTVVPNRNKIFSSIIQAAALSIQKENPDAEVVIGLGIHAGDHAIYPDCRQEFRDLDYQAFTAGNWDAEKIKYYTPYLEVDKKQILLDGQDSCIQLGLQFSTVYSKTNTSYKPIYDYERDIWYSDYKSGSSVERIQAFMELGKVDPVIYAHQLSDGTIEVVSWEDVCKHVETVLRDEETKTNLQP